MDKQKIKKILIRLFILVIMAVILYFLIQLRDSSVAVFYWSVTLFMMLNFWLHLKKEKKENYSCFFFALGVGILFLIVSALSLFGHIIQSPPFQGIWAKLLGWHSFIAMFLLIIYALILFDKNSREDLKTWFNKKNRL